LRYRVIPSRDWESWGIKGNDTHMHHTDHS
jgi:hypothetical protein